MNVAGTRRPITPPGVEVHPVCECHGEPMLWQKEREYRAGGRWRCRIARAEANQRRREQRVANGRERYADPLYRIRRLLRQRRREALVRKANRLLPREEARGEVPHQRPR